MRLKFLVIFCVTALVWSSCSGFTYERVCVSVPALPVWFTSMYLASQPELHWTLESPLCTNLTLPALTDAGQDCEIFSNSTSLLPSLPLQGTWVLARLLDTEGLVYAELGAIVTGSGRYELTLAGGMAAVMAKELWQVDKEKALVFNFERLQTELETRFGDRAFLCNRPAMLTAILESTFNLYDLGRDEPSQALWETVPGDARMPADTGWYWLDNVFAGPWQGDSDTLSCGTWRFWDSITSREWLVSVQSDGRITWLEEVRLGDKELSL